MKCYLANKLFSFWDSSFLPNLAAQMPTSAEEDGGPVNGCVLKPELRCPGH